MTAPPPAPPPDTSTARPAGPRSLAHRWLLVLPFVWQVGLVPVVNDVDLAPLRNNRKDVFDKLPFLRGEVSGD